MFQRVGEFVMRRQIILKFLLLASRGVPLALEAIVFGGELKASSEM